MRLDGWEVALAGEIEAARGLPFSWGTHDCATWAFEVRRALTGIDDARRWRGRYRTAAGGAKVQRKLGWATLAEGATALLGGPLAGVLLAQRGDIVLMGEALGVCVGSEAAFLTPDGLTFVPLRDCALAWRA